MIRLAARATLSVLADGVALIVGALILDRMSLSVGGFFLALALFTLTDLLVEPLIRQTALRSSPALLGSSALLSTLVSLIVSAVVADGLQINGLTTWLLATVIVWAAALGARIVLPLLLFKKVLANATDQPGRR